LQQGMQVLYSSGFNSATTDKLEFYDEDLFGSWERFTNKSMSFFYRKQINEIFNQILVYNVAQKA